MPYFTSGTYNCITNQALGVYTVGGITPPFTFTVVNAVTNATFYTGVSVSNSGTFSPVPVGSYNVYYGSAGCPPSLATFTVFSNPSINILFSNINMVTCNGGNNGSAAGAMNPLSGFQSPFTYSWTSGSSAPTATNLSAGTVSVTITDNQGCSLTNTIQITQPNPISTSLSNTLTLCHGGTLSAVVSSTGGTGAFNYTVNGTPVAGNTVTGLSAGITTVIARDANGCIKTTTFLISQPVTPSINFNVTKPSCPSSTNGAVSTTISDAPAAYSFTWQPTGAVTPGLNNIPVGNYTLTLKDGHACITKSVVTVSPATVLNATINTNPENCSASDGAFTVNMTAEAAPYTYSTVSVGSSPNNVLSGLSSGAYTTIVSDANNCSDTLKIIVGNLSTVSVSIVSFSPVLCYNNCTGSVQVSVQNGVAPLTYSATGTPTTLSNIITNFVQD